MSRPVNVTIVKLGAPTKTFAGHGFDHFQTVDDHGYQRDWHKYRMDREVADRIAIGQRTTVYYTSWIARIDAIRPDGQRGYFSNEGVSGKYFFYALGASILFLILSPFVIFIFLLPISLIATLLAIPGTLQARSNWRRFKRDERRLGYEPVNSWRESRD